MRLHSRGAAMAEFAVLLPLLMITVLGLIELGRFAYYTIVVGNAAHAGAQYGAESSTNAGDLSGMQTAATTDGANNIHAITAQAHDVCSCWNPTSRTLTPSTPTNAACGQTCTTGQLVGYVQVTTSGSFNPIVTYPGLPTSYSVSATATMRVRQ